MLLKVSDGVNGWVFMDKVTDVHFLSGDMVANSAEQLQSMMVGENAVSCVRNEVFEDNADVPIGELELRKEGTTKRAYFTGDCFLCNDAGDTLDRFRAFSQSQRKGNTNGKR